MTTPSPSNLLQYANLQMAAEAFLVDDNPPHALKGDLQKALTDGNFHSSKFTEAQATEFLKNWEVVAQQPNTGTGFSGTLFKRRVDDPVTGAKVGDLVMSFRSTEFIDDAAHDNQVTNVLEIKAFGWAFGQIADMKEWVDGLYQKGEITAPLTVTGYSLGGHLATAFNELYSSRVNATYTFNGAGVGDINDGHSLKQVIERFNALRSDSSLIAASFTDSTVRNAYVELQADFGAGSRIPTVAEIAVYAAWIDFGHPQAKVLVDALTRMRSIGLEAQRVNNKVTDTNGGSPKDVLLGEIDGMNLSYQIAVLKAAEFTSSYNSGVATGGWAAIAERNILEGKASNFYDVYGANLPSAVSNSQWHYGKSVPVFIEDQPLARGSVVLSALLESVKNAEAKLLVDGYSENDFGDTHSLVLIVDSLSVQALFAKLDNTVSLDTLHQVFQEASYRAGDTDFLSQGTAEGDTLENVVNWLSHQLGVQGPDLKGNLKGGTWAETKEVDGYTGREELHKRLKAITDQIEQKGLAGQLKVAAASAVNTAAEARSNFGYLVALLELSPFVLSAANAGASGALDAVWAGAFPTEYAAWQADKSDATPDTYTDQWIADRAALLRAFTVRNEQNNTTGQVFDRQATAGQVTFFDFTDPVTGQGAVLSTLASGVSGLPEQHILFGDDQANVLTGYNNFLADHLYGGEGNDTLSGLDGADYLEGNVGDDTLIGGAGNDTLVGGIGNDRYEFSSSFGEDLLIDSDGNGTVWIDQVQLKGGKKIQGLPNSWISDDKRWRYELGSNGDLLIRHADGSAGSVLLRGWQNGGGNRLGIGLEGAPAPVPQAPTLRIYLGDQAAPLTVNGAGQPIYDWGATTWQVNGTLTGGVAQAAFADVIKANGIDLDTDTRIFGYGGNDALGGADGDDEIDGGEGDDLIAGGKGSNTLRGGAGNDFISASSYINAGQRVKPGEIWSAAPAGTTVLGSGPTWGVYETASGEQTWVGVSATPTDVSTGSVIDAGEGNDNALGSWAGDTIYMGAGNDLAQGLAGRDVIYGQDGDDRLYGDGTDQAGHINSVPGEQHGDDLIDGGAGNDSISGQGGSDVLLGGAGNDKLTGDGDVRAQFHGKDVIDGGLGDDTLWGGGEDDYLDGGADDDEMYGDVGDDILYGGTGDDQMQGDNGAVSATDGNDYLNGDAGDDSLMGNGGNDTLYGGIGNDTLQGDNGAPSALDGDDSLDGGDGNDFILGGGGDDRLTGGAGADEMNGDAGAATQFDGKDTLDGGAGNDTMAGGGGADVLLGGDGDDYLMGDNGPETAFDGADRIDGGDGNDNIFGQGGDDNLTGGAGDDSLVGGSGNDTLTGGSGVDYLMGGSGDDIYVFRAGDSTLNASNQADVVEDDEGRNVLRFEGLNSSEATVSSQSGTHLVLRWGGSSAAVVLGGVNNTNQRYVFADGVALDHGELIGRLADVAITGTNADGTRRLMGGRRADSLVANRTGDVVSGGRGDDTISGSGAGGHTYIYQLGDGADTLIDTSTKVDGAGSPTLNKVVFGEGISQSDVRLTGFGGRLRLVIGADLANSITFESFDVSSGSSSPIDLFEFSDGSALTYAELIGRGFVGDGSDEEIMGTSGDDHISGNGGDDLLNGGAGFDVYVFRRGDGRDEIRNTFGPKEGLHNTRCSVS